MSVSSPLPHDSATLHVTGQARYTDDIPTPRGTLHLAFGLSTIARGKIDVMALQDVRTAPGVVLVLTAHDLKNDTDVSPSAHDEPLLAQGEVHYLGQPLFLVIAESHIQARQAARKAQITYSETTPILTIDDAMAAGSHFEDGPRIWQRGTPEIALQDAPNHLEGSIEMGGQEHFYLEGQAALAQPQDNGDILVQSSTQHPSEIQHKVAHALGLPMHAVRVEIRRMGGGFGGKESQGNALAVSCALAASMTGRCCKMRYDRDDDMMITGKRHDFRISYKVGYDDDGRVLGLTFLQLARCGWAQDLSLPVADRAMLHSDNAYQLDHIRIESHRLKTNTQSATAFRGFGGPQGMLGIERVMDHIAHALGKDPLEVRRLNFYADGAEGGPSAPPGEAKLPHPPEGILLKNNTTPYGQKVVDFVLHDLVEQLCDSADYPARCKAVAEWNAQNPILKRGLALVPVKFGISFTLTHLNQAGALVHVYQDGSVQMNHGGTEMGQGLHQKLAQVAAARFGQPLSAVRITATDTSKVPNTSATAASSGSDLNGMAVKAACDLIRARMADFIAAHHQCRADQIEFSGGLVLAGDTVMTFAQAAKLCYENRISLSATGFYKTPKLEWDRLKGQGQPFYYFAYGAALTEVVLDRLTGENRILRADVLHDAGASLNPALDIGQVEGGYVQGAGWLTTEELVWDDNGALRTHAPSTYKIPACSDRPDVFNVSLYENPNVEDTIYRSKAVGEPPLMLGISAFLALSDAVAQCCISYPDLDAPATPERLFTAVQKVSDV
ncbi:MAG: xanthine dehydrogenase molybdopterin binding subunit [Cognatishimia sp.]